MVTCLPCERDAFSQSREHLETHALLHRHPPLACRLEPWCRQLMTINDESSHLTHADSHAHTFSKPPPRAVSRLVFDQRSQVFVTTDQKPRLGVITEEEEECVE